MHSKKPSKLHLLTGNCHGTKKNSQAGQKLASTYHVAKLFGSDKLRKKSKDSYNRLKFCQPDGAERIDDDLLIRILVSNSSLPFEFDSADIILTISFYLALFSFKVSLNKTGKKRRKYAEMESHICCMRYCI